MNTPPGTAAESAKAETSGPNSEFDFSRQIPTPYRILGLTMRPLSIGRYRRLAAHACAFVSETEQTAGLGDLLLGVICCSMTCAEFDAFAASPQFEPEVRRWSRRIMPSPLLGRVAEWFPCWLTKTVYTVWSQSRLGERWRSRHAVNLAEKFELFRRYITDAQKMPRYVSREAKEVISTAHWCDNVEMTLRNQLGWSGTEIEEQPLSKALADYLNWAAANDLVTIFTEEDLDEGDKNAAILEKAFASSTLPLPTSHFPQEVPWA